MIDTPWQPEKADGSNYTPVLSELSDQREVTHTVAIRAGDEGYITLYVDQARIAILKDEAVLIAQAILFHAEATVEAPWAGEMEQMLQNFKP